MQGPVGRAIVHADKLDVGECLGYNRIEGGADIIKGVVDRHNYTDLDFVLLGCLDGLLSGRFGRGLLQLIRQFYATLLLGGAINDIMLGRDGCVYIFCVYIIIYI